MDKHYDANLSEKLIKVKSSFGAHVLVFIDIKAIEVHNIHEYLTICSKSIALHKHGLWARLLGKTFINVFLVSWVYYLEPN